MRQNNRIVRKPRNILQKYYKAEIRTNQSPANFYKIQAFANPENQVKKYCSDELEEINLLAKLEELDYQLHENEGQYIEMMFTEVIRDHVRFISYRPYGITLIGTNLLTYGKFHVFWWKVIEKQPYIQQRILKQIYYNACKNLIKNQLDQFQEIFIIHQQSPQVQIKNQSSYENSDNNMFPLSLPLEQDKIDQNCMQFSKSNDSRQTQQFSSSQSGGNSLHTINPLQQKKLFHDGHQNQRVITAELVCLFFRIPQERIFPLQQIQITDIYQNYCQKQFELGIVEAIVPQQHQNWQNKPRKCIISYKIYSFEQLLRVQHTHGDIYGFITYDSRIDIYQYLQDIMKKK